MTMPALTDMQRAFVVAYVAEDGNGAKAAELAGFSAEYARQAANRLLGKPHILAALHVERERRLARVSTSAIGLLESVIGDTAAPIAQRVKAAGMVLDRAGHTPPKRRAGAPGDDEKPLQRMNKAELERAVQAIGVALASAKQQTIDLQAEAVVEMPEGGGEPGEPARLFQDVDADVLAAEERGEPGENAAPSGARHDVESDDLEG